MYYSYAFIAQLNNIRERTILKVSNLWEALQAINHKFTLTTLQLWFYNDYSSCISIAQFSPLPHCIYIYIYILIICILRQHLREYYFSMQLDFFFSTTFYIIEILYSFFFFLSLELDIAWWLAVWELKVQNISPSMKERHCYAQISCTFNYVQNFGFHVQDLYFYFFPWLLYFTCQPTGKNNHLCCYVFWCLVSRTISTTSLFLPFPFFFFFFLCELLSGLTNLNRTLSMQRYFLSFLNSFSIASSNSIKIY